jgi:NAD(P)-dependent dehydrogenase (short-subunit alcohol dehydrogenase family)
LPPDGCRSLLPACREPWLNGGHAANRAAADGGAQLRPKGVVSAYAATKAAQHNLIQSQARDYAQSNVLLNTLAPGLIDTDRNAGRRDNDPEGWAQYTRSLNWMGRAGQPSEMVGAAIFLASDACSFMTGEAIFLTGGY